MKRFSKLLMVVMVMAMIIGGSVQCLAADTAATPVVSEGTVAVTLGNSFPDFLMSEVHQQNYLRYLVKEYDPASLTQWEKAFTARKAAKKELAQMLTVTLPASAEVPGVISVTLPNNTAYSWTLPNVAIPAETAKSSKETKILAPAADDVNVLGSTEVTEPDPLYSDFEKAVEIGDAQAIKAVLPKILDKYVQVTEDMVKDISINAQNN